MATPKHEKFHQGSKIVSNRESADIDAEGNGTQHVPVVKQLSWAVAILEAQIGISPQSNC